jgi:hypothetical protein
LLSAPRSHWRKIFASIAARDGVIVDNRIKASLAGRGSPPHASTAGGGGGKRGGFVDFVLLFGGIGHAKNLS